MDYDKEQGDEMVLALMWLVMHGDKYGARAWKGFDWDRKGMTCATTNFETDSKLSFRMWGGLLKETANKLQMPRKNGKTVRP